MPGRRLNAAGDATDGCTLFDGRLTVRQPRAGYRFSLDALLLAWWTAFDADDLILDAGCGAGVVALVLAGLRGARRLVGMERQSELAAFARANVRANNLDDRVTIHEGDLRAFPPELAATFDVVCANPPFREVGGGRLSGDGAKAEARAELTLTMPEVTQAAAAALKKRGRLFLIHQPRRLAALIAALGDAGFGVETLRFVHPRAGAPAKLVLVAARLGGAPETAVLPPLVVQGADGGYGPEVAALYRGEPDALARGAGV
jgi:tRNA1Val (adenine37-N6)-methyltransferase